MSPAFCRAFLFLISIAEKKNYLLSKNNIYSALEGDFNMASRKFRFVSPGVFLKEIDRSQIPRTPEGVGPIIIGRTRKGPSMKPYKVRSFEEFDRVFGSPMPGNQGEDPWREGTGILAESYLPYAAKAYLSADIDSPVTVIRLAGVAGDDAVADGDGEPGWVVGNAIGLFLIKEDATINTGSLELGAILYGVSGSDFGVKVNGKKVDGDTPVVSASASVSPTEDGRYTIKLSSSAGTKDVTFAFGDIRKELNTNPVMTNLNVSSVVSGTLSHHYWLGESFEQTYQKMLSETTAGKIAMVAAPLSALMNDFKSKNHSLLAGRTGWIFGNDMSTDPANFEVDEMQRLFRLVAQHEGSDASRDLTISIENISPAREGAIQRFGTFSVVVKVNTPTEVVEVERFDDCDLDPNSQNFVARRIGDTYAEWDSIQKINKIYGTNPNVSELVRVEMNPEIETQGGPINPETVPFGFYGPIIPKTKTISQITNGSVSNIANSWISGTLSLKGCFKNSAAGLKIKFPSLPLVTTGSTENGSTSNFRFGATPHIQDFVSGSGIALTTMNKGYIDYVRCFSSLGTLLADQKSGLAGDDTEVSYKFTLDDVVLKPVVSTGTSLISGPGDVKQACYVPGSRQAEVSSQRAFSAHASTGSANIRTMLDMVKGFDMPLVGGNDGVDITEPNPFNMRVVDANATTANNYAYASIDRAIELIRDPEIVEHNLAAMPGVTNESLTTKLVRTCEARADSLAIIDLADIYKPPYQQKCATFKNRVSASSPERSAAALVKRQLNSSYGATYYPWIKIVDEQHKRDVWVPPSVLALGVMAYTEERDEVWFAPAGFNRGGLNSTNVGLPVIRASEQLLSKDRDTLYAANINPIAQFVSEGLVIFGQKTLQSSQSALDRINVRRLLIFVKKEVSRISNGLLFEQNIQATWTRFTNQVVPFLESVKTRFGLSDFKVVLDETTTTPDLVDRNILYAKVFLKPARSIEFIAVDFVITNTGASFED